MFSVKKCRLFEGLSLSFGIGAEQFKGAQNTHEANKTDFLRNHQEKVLLPFFPLFRRV